ncbi:chemokine (C-X-C motif) ligand 5 [Rattus norvegicus]|uniref:C-X-C motif chemokine n=2 Tax=Rattus norvegicus TaxID=10116 RepID=A6KKE7_RAT|nr:C-X-C motif chemokine 5 precursor [Rattus norvegicus]EDL88563.1 chemokine (C-X-C motif) ligand 5 [Rattus norvegicus]|eukprot:XP_017454857.1 PREDICTED: C-X-C motif chemokine 5 isoform X2 [Rattus norvegicus]
MSFQLRSSARIPSRSCSSFTLLAFLLLFTLPQHRAQAAPFSAMVATELRCVCLTLAPRINPKMIANLEVIPAGPHCPKVEVIAKLKNQKDNVCLDPEAPLIKKVIQKILGSENKKTKRNALALVRSASTQ